MCLCGDSNHVIAPYKLSFYVDYDDYHYYYRRRASPAGSKDE